MFRKTRLGPAQSVPKHELVHLYRQALQAGMSLEKLHQKIVSSLVRSQVSVTVEQLEDERAVLLRHQQLPFFNRVVTRTLPVLCVFIGVFLVGSAVGPILGYYLFTAPELYATSLLSPIPREQVLESGPQLVAQVQARDITGTAYEESVLPQLKPTIIDSELDYTNLSNWFPQNDEANLNEENTVQYTIDIPSLNVYNAVVKIGGSNLSKNVIQYPGTALPGEAGTPVLFGHSVLDQFYSPGENNPNRYNSIFTRIIKMKKGEKIYITHDNVRYTYLVTNKYEVKPEDTYILEQNYDARTIKLVTCTPPGFYSRRGIIEAELVSQE